ncbi:hypothetical protein [Microcystis phage Mwe-JY08]
MQPDASGSEPSKLPVPEGLDPAFWDETSGLKAADLAAHLSELRAFKAAEDSKRAAVPDDPSKYELKLPDDWKPPVEGVEFQFNPDDPMVGLGRQIAQSLGLDQSGFEKVVGIYAQSVVAAEQQHQARIAAAVAQSKEKLGPKADERISAVEQWVAAVMGPQVYEQLKPGLAHHDLVVGIEKAMRHASSGGAPAYSQTGRAPAPSDMTDDEWNKLSLTERLSRSIAREKRVA